MSTATSLRDVWRANPWWAKVLLAIGVLLFLLEVAGVVDQLGLAGLNLTIIAFLFSINGTLGELGATLNRIEDKL